MQHFSPNICLNKSIVHTLGLTLQPQTDWTKVADNLDRLKMKLTLDKNFT